MTGINLKKRSVRFLIPPETMGKLSYNNKYLKSNGSIFVIKMMALIATITIIANNIASSFYRKKNSLREKCLYSEVFWPVFSRIQTEYGETLHISPYSVQMSENVDQSNSEYGLF